MPFKKGQSVELTISDLAFGGAGVGKLKSGDDKGDFVVFVEGVVPGDRIQAFLYKVKKNYAEARFERMILKSPERIAARCKHFGVCGGCSLQFLDYKNQLKWKQKMVEDSLQKIGGFAGLEVAPILGCETPWYYRNKMEYSFGVAEDGKTLSLGLHPARRFQDVFDVQECFLESAQSVAILEGVSGWMRERKIESFDPRKNTGVLKTLAVREGKNTNEILVNLFTNGGTFARLPEFVEWMGATFPQVTSLYHTEVMIRKGHRTVVKEVLCAGKPTLSETLQIATGALLGGQAHADTLKFEILPQAFFQPNTKQAQILYREVLRLAAPQSSDVMLDLFCGTGTIGMFFSKHTKKVFGIDLSESAIENAIHGAKVNGLSNIDFLCGDAGKLLKDIPERPTILVTDPPRAGIAQSALGKILTYEIPRWVYVSCNPTTLARDLKIITEKSPYKIRAVQPVDMFPHTYHVETVCLLERA